MQTLAPHELADRAQRAAAAALAAGRDLGLHAERATILHDVFSVVVHLEPEPVVARIPVVLTAATAPHLQAARQQRELDVAAWLDEQGVPVIPPAPQVPRRPVRRDGFPMSFWQKADLADDHQPYRGVDISYSAELHAALAACPVALPFLAPFNSGLPDMLAALDDVDLLSPGEIDRARSEFAALQRILSNSGAFEAAFPHVPVQPVQGDGPSHNVIRTTTGIRFSDFEDVSTGPVEWDLALMDADDVAGYDRAARRLGLRPTDPDVLRVMDQARRLQFVGCLTLIPQLPVLAEGLKSVLQDWRSSPPADSLL